MDKIINILLLIIIFVFDPLAIALVIAANYAFEQLKERTRENIYGEKEVVEDDGMWTEEEIEDFNEQFNADDLIPDEEEDWEVVDEEEIRDLNRDGIIDEEESNILKVLEETSRQYKVLFKDGTIRWIAKPDDKTRKVY